MAYRDELFRFADRTNIIICMCLFVRRSPANMLALYGACRKSDTENPTWKQNMNWLSLRIASGINRCKIIKNYCFEKIERQTKKKKRITNGVVWWRLRESILCYMQCYIGVRNMSVTIATGTRDFYFGIYTQLKSLDNRPNRIDFF